MWHMGDGWGWWMVFGWLWMVAFWGLIIWAVYAITRPREPGTGAGARGATAMEILERRYASGEINDQEFEERRRLIAPSDMGATAGTSYPPEPRVNTPSGNQAGRVSTR